MHRRGTDTVNTLQQTYLITEPLTLKNSPRPGPRRTSPPRVAVPGRHEGRLQAHGREEAGAGASRLPEDVERLPRHHRPQDGRRPGLQYTHVYSYTIIVQQ